MLSHLATIIISVAVANACTSASSCCAVLCSSEYLVDKVSSENTTAYNDTIYSFWSGQARTDTPTCVVEPTAASDVAVDVAILAEYECQFSIKGGGHTPWARAASINDRVTINIAGLNSMSLNTNKSIAYLGSGSRWGPIYEYLESQGTMVSRGRASDIGIGGLVVGGGYSWFAP
ncbi:hypothetical protein BP5796_02943 [Coleophoma crateriformis]|uniref:FAD-binding PCMH-type domain-containing protein n=1 Tax=Coleophoma crateriformis TaxID=565419 RepID=A0A3D8SLN0_9HELO|nr:hypothetical protein BP5796_02943 [Coleophoma crateriformis]